MTGTLSITENGGVYNDYLIGAPYSVSMYNTSLAEVLRYDGVTGTWDQQERKLTFSNGTVLTALLALATDLGGGVKEWHVATIPQGTYPTADLFVGALDTALAGIPNPWNNSSGVLGATLGANGQLSVARTGGTALDDFKVYGEQDLRGGTTEWRGATFDRTDPMSCNAILGNMGTAALVDSSVLLGTIDLPAAVNALYLHSDTLSGNDSCGPHPQSTTCICKLMLNGAAFGQSIAQSTFRELRYCTVPPQSLQILEWSLRDARNRVVDLRGGKMSFVLSCVFPE